jgi:hypothetical protein
MKTFAMLGALLILTGCADLTPTQKKVAGAVAGVLVVGAIAAYNADRGASSPAADAAISSPSAPCALQPNGTCR